jgi:methyl-accepting chemotaxis protein
VTSLTAQIQVYARNLSKNLAHANTANPSLHDSLAALDEAMQAGIKQSIALTMKEAVGEAFGLPSTEYFVAATKPIDAAIQLTDASTKALIRILDARRQSSHNGTLGTLLFTAAMLLLTGYIVLAMSVGIVHAVDEVNATSTALAVGDLTRPARVDSQNELGRIGDDVNRAREALAHLIQSAKSMSEQVSSTAVHLGDLAARLEQELDRFTV